MTAWRSRTFFERSVFVYMWKRMGNCGSSSGLIQVRLSVAMFIQINSWLFRSLAMHLFPNRITSCLFFELSVRPKPKPWNHQTLLFNWPCHQNSFCPKKIKNTTALFLDYFIWLKKAIWRRRPSLFYQRKRFNQIPFDVEHHDVEKKQGITIKLMNELTSNDYLFFN